MVCKNTIPQAIWDKIKDKIIAKDSQPEGAAPKERQKLMDLFDADGCPLRHFAAAEYA